METEINLLKKEYLATTPPNVLRTSGIADVWKRVDESSSNFITSHFYQVVLVGLLVFVVLSGAGIAIANANPNSILYPVKAITQKTLYNASQAVFPRLPSAILQKKLSPTSTPTPTHGREKTESSENANNNEANKNESPSEPKNTQHEDVKGESTSESHGNNSSQDSQSKNHNSENKNNKGRD